MCGKFFFQLPTDGVFFICSGRPMVGSSDAEGEFVSPAPLAFSSRVPCSALPTRARVYIWTLTLSRDPTRAEIAKADEATVDDSGAKTVRREQNSHRIFFLSVVKKNQKLAVPVSLGNRRLESTGRGTSDIRWSIRVAVSSNDMFRPAHGATGSSYVVDEG